MDWKMLIGIASVSIINLLTIITLYIHLDNKTDNRIQKTNDLIIEVIRRNDITITCIREDMKEFQKGIQDFYGRLCSIEERNKKEPKITRNI